ncbi:hypothetical protein K3495_g16506, partial [Podosphaera aphanis]
PWEEWFGKKPSAKRYKIWGCPAYVHIPKERRKKLDRKAWKGIFIGYSPRNPGIYRIWNPSSYKVHEAKFVIFDELHSKVPYDVILAQQKEELEELCKNEGFKIDLPTLNYDSDDGESTISLEDHPKITSLNRQSSQQPITNYYENKNENDHSDYQTQENISTSNLSSIQNLEHRSTPNNLPESLETSVPESRLALEEPLQLEKLTKTQIKQAQIAHRKAEKEAKIQAERSARRLMEIQRGDRRGRSAAEKANLTKLLEYPRREENHPRLTAAALP